MSKIQDALKKLQSAKSGAGGRGEEDRIRTVEQVGAIVEIGTDPNSFAGMSDRFVAVDRDSLRMAGLLAPEAQQTEIGNQYRLIKRPLLNLARGKGAHVSADSNLIVVASALSGDGKTFTAINLALSIALEKDNNVLLVDADVPKRHISSVFGLKGERGLIDLLKNKSLGPQDVIMETDVPGLRILPAGEPDEFATELLASQRMRTVARKLSDDDPNRIIIFDSPPLLATSEAPVLASLMGQIVIVIKANHTPQRAVIEAYEKLEREKAINIVLNQAGGGLTYGYYGYYGNPGTYPNDNS